METQTLQRHLARGEQPKDGQKRVYVIDESSMASTKQLHTFVERLNDHDRVLFVGDTRQHEAVEAGRPYAQLQDAGLRTARLDEITALIGRAETAATRRPELMKQRIAEQVALLLDTSDRFDPDRLHQEAVLIAAKADVREELDRLASHVEQAQGMVTKGGAVGRRLDFLSQEFNRESNTLCAKANDAELTNIGLALKGAVEQFREQVANLE